MNESSLFEIAENLLKKIDKMVSREGLKLFEQNSVIKFKLDERNFVIEATVRDKNNSYEIFWAFGSNKNPLYLRGCSCRANYYCSHFAAMLYSCMENQLFEKKTKGSVLSKELAHWLNQLGAFLTDENNTKKESPSTYLWYKLTFNSNSTKVELCVSNINKNGKLSASSPTRLEINNLFQKENLRAKSLQEEDWAICEKLYIINNRKKHPYWYGSGEKTYDLENQTTLLQAIVSTGRAHIELLSSPLVWGEERQGTVSWEVEAKGQKVVAHIENGGEKLPGFVPFCYFDSQQGSVGLINFEEKPALIESLLNIPTVASHELILFNEMLQKKAPRLAKYAPQEIKEVRISGEPKAFLRAFSQEGTISLTLYFDYKEIALTALAPTEPFVKELKVGKKNQLFLIERDELFEKALYKDLEKSPSLLPLSQNKVFNGNRCHFSLSITGRSGFISLEERTIYLFTVLKPQLDLLEVALELDKSLPFKKIHEPTEWSLEAEESKGVIDWFDVALATLIEGKRVNILPDLLRFAETIAIEGSADNYFAALTSSQKIAIPTQEGEVVLISSERLYNIFKALSLEFAPPLKNGKLQLSKWQTTHLVEVEKGNSAAQMRWIGPDQLRKVAENLEKLEGELPLAILPKNFHCELRHYQQEGLNWLQFLRLCGLNGILADDMGLGKTIQALAHIALEKESGRLTAPALIIAPTSLMANWRLETERFVPELKQLTLQGSERFQNFKKIEESDIIFTTYPLLMRDKDILLSHQYHLLILDEAQVIKNCKTQAYQVVQQLRANHRLCLTGTPMENHLGELWSLFNFLLPGLLGDLKRFQIAFRNPIEKQGSQERKKLLNQRLKPFMLRRTKQEIANELPEKSEIIQRVEMEENQRDFYEAIRLKAQEKVMKQIAEKGLERSQIIILDALLKLRQVCCDPRLVKLENNDIKVSSAKLTMLMEMIPEMIEEKRQILLFSQFTSMLELIRQELDKKGISYSLLTGDTVDRETPVRQFQEGKVPLMLLSLKAGGVGLNLTAADTVIHYDPWWNPAVESQATDRAHRIGQKKNVFVYKLVVIGSIEEKILVYQQSKKELCAAILEGKEGSAKRITMEDLENIFQPLPEFN